MSQNKNKSSNKSFGIVFSVVFLIIAIYPFSYSGEIRTWSLILSIVFMILGLTNSKFLTPLNKIWFKFGIFLFLSKSNIDVERVTFINNRQFGIHKL